MDEAMICVGLCTCRNPIGLSRALEALRTHETQHRFRVVVLENDADEAGRAVAQQFSDRLDISYRVEPTPGIPYARNALIAAARERPLTHLLMIDDDEQPLAGWLDRMVSVADHSGAAIVGGGVVPRFDAPPVPPIEESDFTKSGPAFLGGKQVIDSTANILLSGPFLEQWDGPFFDPSFQHSGGSDSEFLRRVTARGFPHAYAEGAMVVEDIPDTRLREDWLLKRNYRNGNVLGRVTHLHDGRIAAVTRVLPRATVLWLRGAARGLRSGSDLRADFLARKDRARARGMLAALRGSVMQEYAAPSYRR